MAKLIPADLGTHYVLVSITVLVVLAAGLGWMAAVGIGGVVIIGREVYGWRQRGRPMEKADWIESGRDILAGLFGGGVVLLAAQVGL